MYPIYYTTCTRSMYVYIICSVYIVQRTLIYICLNMVYMNHILPIYLNVADPTYSYPIGYPTVYCSYRLHVNYLYN